MKTLFFVPFENNKKNIQSKPGDTVSLHIRRHIWQFSRSCFNNVVIPRTDDDAHAFCTSLPLFSSTYGTIVLWQLLIRQFFVLCIVLLLFLVSVSCVFNNWILTTANADNHGEQIFALKQIYFFFFQVQLIWNESGVGRSCPEVNFSDRCFHDTKDISCLFF